MEIIRVLEEDILFFQDLQNSFTKCKCTFIRKTYPTSDFPSILTYLISFSAELRNSMKIICIARQSEQLSETSQLSLHKEQSLKV